MEKEKYTRYEKTRIISARALQLSQGAKAMVNAPKEASPIEIAELEWEKGLIPIDIRKEDNSE